MKFFHVITQFLLITLVGSKVVKAEDIHYEYIVIGAGAAGLSAAYKLRDLNKNFLVLEKETHAGGIAENGVRGRFSYAKGTEYLGKPEGYLAHVIHKLNVQMVEIPSPMDASFFRGKIHIGANSLAKLTIEQSGKQEFQKFINLLNSPEYMTVNQLKQLDHMTAKEWLDQHQISPFIQQRYEIMARGLFGANLSDISALSFIPEAQFDYVDVNEVDELMFPSSESGSWTTEKGIASIATTIADHLAENILYQSTVKKIRKVQHGYQVDFLSEGNVHTLTAQKVILATPAPVAAYIAKEVLTEKQKTFLRKVKYAQYATVALFSDKPLFNKAFDLAIIDGETVTDLYDATWVERNLAPNLEGVKEYIASAYLAPKSATDKSLLKNSDAELLDIIYQELNHIVPNIKQDIKGYDIRRFYNAYPIFDKGYFTRLYKMKSSSSDVYLAGDYMAYPTFDAAFESGLDAVMKAEKDK
ncbi:flavin monoamine oxidase family protein [Vibrio mediterranei]|uniref:FAD-binding protein n=1 Tax=Vibrio mediterranei TaxID=689 RepID=A0A3G4VBZ3_9VIBR|nr:FAD-dependent oxidoreductase [Vibrio mediterranei]AYV22267.1 FAD-binding protein [Vibrio mediterranei]